MLRPEARKRYTMPDGIEPDRTEPSIATGFYVRIGKRIFDVVASASGLVLAAPLLCLIACAVKLTSRGPVLFRQNRAGKGGVPFAIVKFRTMAQNAKACGPGITARGDTRITPLGRFLRRHKLDELPQLWNVLIGEMSLVGPRPEVPRYVARYTRRQRSVLALRPGITGPDAVAYRDEESLLAAAADPVRFYEDAILPRKLEHSLKYLERLALLGDVKIILKTLRSLVHAPQLSSRPSGAVQSDYLAELLGRAPAKLSLDAARRLIEGRAVLVTGAAGSIGSELCAQTARLNPARLVCLDHGAVGVERLKKAMEDVSAGSRISFVVADVGDRAAMRGCLATHKIEFIFHAAAHKHLPALESRVAEAVRNNIFALDVLLQTAEEAGCRAFVLISSDKAVNPSSVMGATKRVGELILASRPQRRMRCVAVRFGNVLGSSGSVVPILEGQLRRGAPLMITHREAKRFFMTGGEAVSLALEAFVIGNHGDILVLEMGEPVKIVDLARKLIRLSRHDERGVRIHFTGLRPGEKLEEELFYSHEAVAPTSCEKIYRARGARVSGPQLRERLGSLAEILGSGDPSRLRAALKVIVPEYRFPAIETADAPADDSELAILQAARDEAI
jgi:lipopolysaccharide/colanic/teichoic acid biosynthesis glycosyltransferase/nucleoside-diphosphate-sugar epimerase